MIKDVLNSIAANSEAGKSKLQKASADESASTGFFGKMLSALQNGEEQAENAQQHIADNANTEGEGQSEETEVKNSEAGKTEANNQSLLKEGQKSHLTFRGLNNEEIVTEVDSKVVTEGEEKSETNIEGEEEAKVVAEGTTLEEAEALAKPVENSETAETSALAEEAEKTLKANVEVDAELNEKTTVQAKDGNQQEKNIPLEINKKERSVNAENTATSEAKATSSEVATESVKVVDSGKSQEEAPVEFNSAKGESVAQKSEQVAASEKFANEVKLQEKGEGISAETEIKSERAEVISQGEGNAKVKASPEAQVAQQAAAKEGITAEKVERNPQLNNSERASAAADLQKQQVFTQKTTQGSPEIHQNIQTSKSEESREKRYDFVQQNAEGNSLAADRLEPVVGSGKGGNSNAGNHSFKAPEWLKYQGINSTASSLTKEQEAFLNDQMVDSPDGTDAQKMEQNNFNYARLGEIPIANSFLRRSVLPGLSSTLMKANPAEQANSQNWQKHSFDLDDGNNIELSTRNVDGVIQVKLASSSVELNRLLQQYGQEIKEHLEQECELNIDLQFEDNPEQEMAGFFDDSSSSGNSFGQRGRSPLAANASTQQAEQNLQHSVRKFGYNRMEWTA